MNDYTSLGGSRGDFPPTTLGLFSRLWDPSAAESRAALETLAGRYWKPVYCYARVAWARTNDDAKDLTQAFFAWLVEEEGLKRYQPDRGSFRGYLKMLLNGFASNQHKALTRLKRGGGQKLLTLDADDAALRDLIPDPAADAPEKAFDRQWLRGVIDQAVARVRERFKADGRAAQFKIYEELEVHPASPPPPQSEVAARHGIREVDLRHHLFAVREAIRSEVRAELAQTTMNMQELEKEWTELFGG